MKKEIKDKINELKKEGYLHYFDLEMYLIVCISYIFGFFGGLGKFWYFPICLLLLAYPYYLRFKNKKLS